MYRKTSIELLFDGVSQNIVNCLAVRHGLPIDLRDGILKFKVVPYTTTEIPELDPAYKEQCASCIVLYWTCIVLYCTCIGQKFEVGICIVLVYCSCIGLVLNRTELDRIELGGVYCPLCIVFFPPPLQRGFESSLFCVRLSACILCSVVYV